MDTRRCLCGLLLTMAVSGVSLPGADSPASGNLSAHIAMSTYQREYASAAMRHPGGSTSDIYVPMPRFEIYDPGGALVYCEGAWQKNSATFAGFPATLKGLKTAAAYRPTYREMLEMVPEFRSRENALLSSGRYTVLYVTQAGCKECSKEDALTSRLRSESERLHIQVLQIVLDRQE